MESRPEIYNKEYYEAARRKNNWEFGDIKIALDHIRSKGESKLLEIGCGMAEILEHIDKISYVGLDPSPFVLEKNKARYPNQQFVIGFAENIPFPAESFDLIFLSQTLQGLSNPRRALEEMVRVLVPGGEIILIAPNLENPWSTVPAVRHYSLVNGYVLNFKRSFDIVRRAFGNLPFRIVPQNYVDKTGKNEKGDDDLRYITSAYEIARYARKIGLEEIFHKPRKPVVNPMKEFILRLTTKIPVFKYYQGGMMFIFKKSQKPV